MATFTLRNVGFFYSILLEVGGTSVAQSRMQLPGVVEGRQIVEDGCLCACLVGNFSLLTNSAFKVETKRSAMALSRAVPVLLINDGMKPTSLSLSPKESEVYRTPSCSE